MLASGLTVANCIVEACDTAFWSMAGFWLAFAFGFLSGIMNLPGLVWNLMQIKDRNVRIEKEATVNNTINWAQQAINSFQQTMNSFQQSIELIKTDIMGINERFLVNSRAMDSIQAKCQALEALCGRMQELSKLRPLIEGLRRDVDAVQSCLGVGREDVGGVEESAPRPSDGARPGGPSDEGRPSDEERADKAHSSDEVRPSDGGFPGRPSDEARPSDEERGRSTEPAPPASPSKLPSPFISGGMYNRGNRRRSVSPRKPGQQFGAHKKVTDN